MFCITGNWSFILKAEYTFRITELRMLKGIFYHKEEEKMLRNQSV
jgi:hypothetical protein